MHELVSQQCLLRASFASQQDDLRPEQAVWSLMGLRFSFYSGKIPKSTDVQK